MKTIVIFTIVLTTISAGSTPTRLIAPNQVPEGITAEDWSIVQETYLKASNAEYNDYFARSVAVSGNTVVIGANESSSATGINGDQQDNSSPQAGAAYIFSGFGTPGSAFITDCSSVPTGFRIEWNPVSGWQSVVKCSTDLVNEPFTNLSTALSYPINSYTDTVSHGQCFYKVDLEP